MNKTLIEKLSKGEVALGLDKGFDVDKADKIISKAFPKDNGGFFEIAEKHFPKNERIYIEATDSIYWHWGIKTDLPTHKIEEFETLIGQYGYFWDDDDLETIYYSILVEIDKEEEQYPCVTIGQMKFENFSTEPPKQNLD